MDAILQTGCAEVVAIAEPSAEMAEQARLLAPGAALVADLDGLIDAGVDGVVIATPSALHAAQSIHALQRGVAVFCQKPLGRTRIEVEAAVEAARAADRLLGIDLSYRYTEGMQRIRDILRSGALGGIYSVDLTFHNAYGPDKPWFYDPALSGGGCVMDLGVHLVDLALWALDFPAVTEVASQLFALGRPLPRNPPEVEDYASATMRLSTGASVRLACSWRLQAGQDAIIAATFYGTEGGVALRNVDGSFYDFVAERYRGTSRETLSAPPDAWGGRAAAAWARHLATGKRFDPDCARAADVACVLDQIYGR